MITHILGTFLKNADIIKKRICTGTTLPIFKYFNVCCKSQWLAKLAFEIKVYYL